MARLCSTEIVLPQGADRPVMRGEKPAPWLLAMVKENREAIVKWLRERRPDLPALYGFGVIVNSSLLRRRVWLCSDKRTVKKLQSRYPDWLVLSVSEVEECGEDRLKELYQSSAEVPPTDTHDPGREDVARRNPGRQTHRGHPAAA